MHKRHLPYLISTCAGIEIYISKGSLHAIRGSKNSLIIIKLCAYVCVYVVGAGGEHVEEVEGFEYLAAPSLRIVHWIEKLKKESARLHGYSAVFIELYSAGRG